MDTLGRARSGSLGTDGWRATGTFRIERELSSKLGSSGEDESGFTCCHSVGGRGTAPLGGGSTDETTVVGRQGVAEEIELDGAAIVDGCHAVAVD